MQRTREGTLDAAIGVLGGAKDIVTGKPIVGLTRIGEGVANVIDVPVSFVADVAKNFTGPYGRKGPSPYKYNFTRAGGDLKEAVENLDVRQTIGGIIDVTHALTTRLGTDAFRLIRHSSKNLAA